jgi:hypothetical protein
VLKQYRVAEMLWAQEEPENMGSWHVMERMCRGDWAWTSKSSPARRTPAPPSGARPSTSRNSRRSPERPSSRIALGRCTNAGGSPGPQGPRHRGDPLQCEERLIVQSTGPCDGPRVTLTESSARLASKPLTDASPRGRRRRRPQTGGSPRVAASPHRRLFDRAHPKRHRPGFARGRSSLP